MKNKLFIIVFLLFRYLSVFSYEKENALWILSEPNKSVVYEQEPVLISYKVYSLDDIINLSANPPDFEGFMILETGFNRKNDFKKERKDGKEYKTAIWNQYVLYPQTTGKLEIPSVTFYGTVVKEKHGDDPIQDFFDGNDGFEEVDVKCHSTSCTITVKPLPEKPADFSGGVGVFTISSSLDKTQVNEDEPVTLRVIISGTGNLKTIDIPKVNLSGNFEKYDPKVTDSIEISEKGYEGSKFCDVIVVPRNDGKYTIPPFKLTYFDLEEENYKTISTQPLELTVSKNESIEQKTGVNAIEKDNGQSFVKMLFSGNNKYVYLGVSLFAFGAFFFFARYQKLKNRKEIQRQKLEMAANMADERLKKAKQMMEEGRNEAFYDEILHTLWQYIANRMKMPVVEMSTENIKEKLQNNHIDEQYVSLFTSAIKECEYERYAPGDTAGNMRKTYESAYNAIMEIEKVYREIKKV